MTEPEPDYEIVQDERGRFTEGTTLSPKRAAEIGRLHHGSHKRESSELADAILAAMQSPEDEAARVRARELLVRVASEIATKQRSGSMAALTSLAGAIREAFSYHPTSLPPHRPGTVCAHCGLDGSFKVTSDGLAYLRKLVKENAQTILDVVEGRNG